MCVCVWVFVRARARARKIDRKCVSVRACMRVGGRVLAEVCFACALW